MKVKEILSLLPPKKLEFLATQSGVDHNSKKLNGIVFFKLLLYTLLSQKDISLRVMESIFQSFHFQSIVNTKHSKVRHSSLAERFTVIKVDFFAKIYEECIRMYRNKYHQSDKEVIPPLAHSM